MALDIVLFFVFAISNGTRFIHLHHRITEETTFSNCQSVQYHPQLDLPRTFFTGSTLVTQYERNNFVFESDPSPPSVVLFAAHFRYV